MKLVFGLGNPGPAYEKSRHNAGFLAAMALSERLHIPIAKTRRQARVGEGVVGGEKVMLVLPQTFMNRSGVCVADFAAYYKVESTDILVLYDDVDLPVGTVRVRERGGPGTHNGMRDIVGRIMTEDFPRVRIGVGAPPPGWDLADYVLARAQGEEQKIFADAVARAAEAAHAVLCEGVQAAMRFNGPQR